MGYITSTFYLTGALFSIVLGIFVFSRNKKASINIIFGLFTLSLFIWLFASSIAYRNTNEQIIVFWFKIALTGVVFVVITLHNFVAKYVNFDKEKKYGKALILATYFTGFIFTILLWTTDIFYKGLYQRFWGYYPKASFLHPIYIFFVVILTMHFTALSYFYLVRQKRSKNILEYYRSKYIFISSLIFTIAASDFSQNYGVVFFPIGFIIVILYSIIVGYAVVRYRLMDIGMAITRVSIFITVYSLVLGIPFVLAFGWKEQLINLVGVNWWMVPLVAMTVLATVGPFIYLYIQRKAEDRLLREQKAYQSVLRSASSGMIRIKDIDKLLNLVVRVVTKTVKIKHAAVYLFDTENNRYVLRALRGNKEISKSDFIDADSPLVWQLTHKKEVIVSEEMLMKFRDEPEVIALAKLTEQLTTLKSALVIPSFVDEKLIGILMLGEKISGKLYSQDDIVVFSVLANQMAIALENIMSYEELKDTKTQLVKLEKLAAIGKLAHSVAHEINNPLTAIKTFTEHLESNYDNQDFRIKFKNIVGSEIERISNVVSQLFNLAKPRLPQFKYGVNIHHLLDSVITLMEHGLSKKGILLVKEYCRPDILLNIDSAQIKQCFLNLVINSIQAIEGGQGKKEIVISTSMPDQKKFCIAISDTGIGISEENMAKIFEPLFTTKENGQGIGLSVVSDIIKAHHGEIKVESKLGFGTTFTIELPRL